MRRRFEFFNFSYGNFNVGAAFACLKITLGGAGYVPYILDFNPDSKIIGGFGELAEIQSK